MHKGWACRPGLRLSADGGLPSIAQRQCPDPVACAVRQHPRGHRFGRGLRVFGRPLCPAPRGPVRWERRVRWDGGPGCGAAPFPCCRRVTEVREVRPSSGGCRKRSLGSYLCPTPWAAKASLHSLGVRCACWAGLTPSALVCPVDGWCHSMLRGRALLGCTRGRVGRGLPGRGRCGSWLTPLPLA